MKRTQLNVLIATGLMAVPFTAAAQRAMDADALNGSDVRGTARFVAMGGAFTSLGGDLSSMSQNPAGLGLYRRSEIGLTFDIGKRNYTSESYDVKKNSQTRANFDNFGYAGTVNLGNSTLRSFTWGVSYQRLNSFYRRFEGYNNPTNTSLSNYIASFTTANPQDLDFDSNYNPYLNSSEDWLSILGYTSFMINPSQQPGIYNGLFKDGTQADAEYFVEERGYQDEYNIDFAGNIADMVYWGVGLGIQDINYSKSLLYNERMGDARVFSESAGTTVTGDAGFDLDSYKTVDGSGVNVKVGVIVRPIDDLRVGMAVHTPTWLHLNHQGDAVVNYNYYDPGTSNYEYNPLTGEESTDWYDFDSRLRTPWRIMFGASYTIASRAIVSLDYERVQYQDMHIKYQTPGAFGYTFVDDPETTVNIKDYFKGGDIVRFGVEYMVLPQLSVRAGYNFQTSHVREATRLAGTEVVTSGVDPSYSLGNDTNTLSFGLGYRYRSWYIDCAYQWKKHSSDFQAYSNFSGHTAPGATVTDNVHSFVISTGFKF